MYIHKLSKPLGHDMTCSVMCEKVWSVDAEYHTAWGWSGHLPFATKAVSCKSRCIINDDLNLNSTSLQRRQPLFSMQSSGLHLIFLDSPLHAHDLENKVGKANACNCTVSLSENLLSWVLGTGYWDPITDTRGLIVSRTSTTRKA